MILTNEKLFLRISELENKINSLEKILVRDAEIIASMINCLNTQVILSESKIERLEKLTDQLSSSARAIFTKIHMLKTIRKDK